MNEPLIIVANIVATQAHRDTVREALRKAAAAVISEPGCERYELHDDLDDANTFVMIEQWRDVAAAELHNRSPAFTALASTLDGKASLHVTKLTRVS